jgi:protein involved in polysaccharide export with SLBB domain
MASRPVAVAREVRCALPTVALRDCHLEQSHIARWRAGGLKARRSGLVALALLLGLTGPTAAQVAYQLGPLDRVRVIVSEWAGAGGEVRTRLSGEFAVSAAGQLSLPLLGELQASGRTVAELSQAISTQMQSRAGLLNPPVASVEIVQHRPFYILGFVAAPGEYAFRPGMTVLQAVAIAGGVFRFPGVGSLRLERDAVSAAGELEQQRTRIAELLVRRGRLQAELAGPQTPLERPAELAGEPGFDELMRREGQILQARRQSLGTSIRAQQELRRLAEEQVASLQAQTTAQRRRLEIVTQEAEDLRSLRTRGLATAARDFTVAAAVAEVEARLRELQTEILRARQNITAAEQTLERLPEERRLELLGELDRVEATLGDARSRERTAAGLLQETESAARSFGMLLAGEDRRSPGYAIMRLEGADMRELAATAATPLQPGDLVRVIPPPRALPLPDTGRAVPG